MPLVAGYLAMTIGEFFLSSSSFDCDLYCLLSKGVSRNDKSLKSSITQKILKEN